MLMVLWSVERAKHYRFVTVPPLLRDDPPAGRPAGAAGAHRRALIAHGARPRARSSPG